MQEKEIRKKDGFTENSKDQFNFSYMHAFINFLLINNTIKYFKFIHNTTVWRHAVKKGFGALQQTEQKKELRLKFFNKAKRNKTMQKEKYSA